MAFQHDGKVAVVTGAAMGIGQAYARRLAADGAQVVAADVVSAAETVATIEKDGGRAIAAALRCKPAGGGDGAGRASCRRIRTLRYPDQ